MIEKPQLTEQPVFHLGLTMAGAVSAGCYSAGVMDYLFEILDLWERAKAGQTEIDPDLVPTHKVVIEAMGGASAGGMTTMMSGLYALGNDVKPVTKPLGDCYVHQNILYDSWVHLNDDQVKTFRKLWNNSDFDHSDNKFYSLLNTQSIDEIAKRAFDYYRSSNLKENVKALPSYISQDLELILSHTLLRGIPLEVDFSTIRRKGDDYKPTHTSYEHALLSHFKLNYGNPVDPAHYFWFNPYEPSEKERMINSTIATGAFPLGLKFRKFSREQFSHSYIKSMLKRSIFSDFGKVNPDETNILLFDNLPEDYETITVDGGAVNNEPYSEVASIVHNRAAKNGTGKLNFGVIMIDPFPDMIDKTKVYAEEEDLISVIPAILSTLRQQSKIKRKEMIEKLSKDYVKGQIYPKRNIYNAKKQKIGVEKYPIASGSFEAFGGFLDVKFREHDFFLGRDNARNFFRYFFSLPEDAKSPIHAHWTEEMKQVFGFIHKDEEKLYLPIIPDLKLLEALHLDRKLEESDRNELKNKAYTLSGLELASYSVPKRPQYDPTELFEMEGIIQARFKRILEVSKARLLDSKKPRSETKQNENYDAWVNGHYFKSPWKKFMSVFIRMGINIVFSLTKRSLSKAITESAIKAIIKDLDEKDLLAKAKKNS